MTDEYIIDSGEPAVEEPRVEEPTPAPEAGTPEPPKEEPKEAPKEESAEEREKKSKSGIHRLKAQRDSERAAREQAEKRIAELEAKLQQAQAPGKPVAPKEAEFETFDEFRAAQEKYNEELVDWKLNDRLSKERQSQAQTEERRRVDEAQQTLRQKIATAHEVHPDLQGLLEDLDGPVPPAIDAFLRESEIGGEVLYHLASHKDELEKIASLSPMKQVVELGKLAERLEKPESKPTPKPAPKPPTPVTASSAAPVKTDGYLVY